MFSLKSIWMLALQLACMQQVVNAKSRAGSALSILHHCLCCLQAKTVIHEELYHNPLW